MGGIICHIDKISNDIYDVVRWLFGLLNETLLTTALPRIMKDFNIEYSQVQWLTTAFLLTNGVVIPLSAFIIQRYSTRQVFLTGILIFFIGTMLGGFSPNFTILLIARIIQALGSGIMMPLMMTTILDVFQPHERGKYMGMFGLVIGLAPAIGPTLSGYLVEFFDWRSFPCRCTNCSNYISYSFKIIKTSEQLLKHQLIFFYNIINFRIWWIIIRCQFYFK